MKRKVFRGLCLLLLTTLLLTSTLTLDLLSERSYHTVQTRVRSEAALVADGIGTADDVAFLRKATASLPESDHITLIGADGAVLYDSSGDGAAAGNQSGQPEVAAVLAGAKSGERSTVARRTRTFYYAVALDGGRVLRLCVETPSNAGQLMTILPVLILLALLLALLAEWIARNTTAAIVRPLALLDLEHPRVTDVYEELAPLLRRIALQNRLIESHARELSTKQEELRALSENINEGLLLIDNHAAVMSINRSAMRLLGGDAGQEYIGRHVLQLTRVYELQKLIEQVQAGKNGSRIMTFSGRQYQVFANAVDVDGEQSGALLLFLDVTEQQQAERMRREFSANVSHELKTPLTSISGYAEMMAGGMVRAEDIQDFAGRIYQEARRLLALIDDIIKLSGLDENRVELHRETVDLYALAQQTAHSLALQAQERQVEIVVEGSPVTIQAVPTMVGELLYNLTENAVKYNRKGGKVTVGVQPADEGIELRVQDTGIGIAPKDQEHVFERFYRVDKSRSKETGGTGLGLSIVKHIAQLHGARIDLQSREGEGTCIRVIFPKNQVES